MSKDPSYQELEARVRLLEEQLARKDEDQAPGSCGTSGEQVDRFLQACPMGVHTYRLRDDRLVFDGANPAADTLLGIDHSELIGMTLEQAFPPLSGTEVPQRYREVCSDGTPWSTEQIDYEDTRIRGAYAVHAYQTAPGSMAVFFADITARRQMEEDLLHGHQRMQLAMEAAHFGLWDWNIAKGTTFFSHSYLTLLGYSPDELPDDYATWEELLHPDDRERHIAMVKELRASQNGATEFRLRGKDGQYRWVLSSGRVTDVDDEGHPRRAVGIHLDVTERRKMEDDLHKARKLESIGVLAGGIAHDFNNLLTGIVGNISLAQSEEGLSPALARRLEQCMRATDRTQQLTQQLLTFSAGGEPNTSSNSIEEIVETAAEFMLRGSNVRHEIRIHDEIWPVEADHGQISQVVENLAQNADEAMPSGGVLSIAIKNRHVSENSVLPVAPGRYVSLSFKDTGEGINKEALPRVFDPYFSTRDKGRASGLGLAICHSIVKRHGGHLAVESSESNGAHFTLILPASQHPVTAYQSSHQNLVRGSGRVLVMDDEQMVIEIVEEMLRCLGYTVETARDGREALARYREAKTSNSPFDAIILDLTIPGGMGGMEVMQVLRDEHPEARVIVSSGYSNEPVMSAYGEHGFVAAVPKPYTLDGLSRTLERVVGRKPTS